MKINKTQHKPEKLATKGTQDEDKKNKNTIQRNWQHRVHKMKINKTQHNPEKLATYRVHKMKINKTQHNPEKLAT
jgi:hypothetical protein